ncbi:MAG: S-layer homology domain-containing protein [Firmicutes bacterium]|nr:S-layer homology domain-containing protein [Bacillota bacterium]
MRRTFIILLLAAIMCLAVALPALAVDDYPSKYRDVPKDSVTDEWRFYNRECVSFVAWCLSSRNGIAFSNYMNGHWWGNANTWDDTARALGYRVDNTPAVGAVAYWDNGYYGHVAWVAAVDGNNVTIEEYNYDYDGGYHTRTIPASEPYGYIHIKDLPSTPPAPVVSVDFSDWQDEDYTFIGETDAVLGQKITVSNGKCSKVGLYLIDEEGAFLAEAEAAYDGKHFVFDMNGDCGFELAPGTVYLYEFYAVVDGKTYWSEEYSFTTEGENAGENSGAEAGQGTKEPPLLGNSAQSVHFPTVKQYNSGLFTDVAEDDWYAAVVKAGYELGLITGMSDGAFDPKGQLTIAQTVTMAARLHSIYYNGEEDIPASEGPWYQAYMDYAYKNGIINSAYYFCDVNEPANRAQFAEIFADALPAEALAPINDIADGDVPDVGADSSYADAVYLLYRAGILQGRDSGYFYATSNINRAEAAAMLSRMAESDNRLEFEL